MKIAIWILWVVYCLMLVLVVALVLVLVLVLRLPHRPAIVEKPMPVVVEVEKQVVVEKIVHDKSTLQERCFVEPVLIYSEQLETFIMVGERALCGAGLRLFTGGPSFASWLADQTSTEEFILNLWPVGDDPETILSKYKERR